MKKWTIIYVILILSFSCTNQKQRDIKNYDKDVEKEFQPAVFNDTKDSSVYQVRRELLTNWIKSSESYKSVSWSKVETMNNPIFKYRVFHKFICSDLKFKPFDSGTNEYEMFFHLDSLGNVIATGLKEDYLKYYSPDGQQKTMYSGFKYEKIALDNNLDLLIHENDSKTIQIVSKGQSINGKIGMTKSEFQKMIFFKLDKDILQDIDTIDYCVDMTGEDCKLYIFENNILKLIKNGL
jgi:hypothetical protein